MNLPSWVLDALRKLDAPKTGQVVVKLELYQGGVTKIELGSMVRVKPEQESPTK